MTKAVVILGAGSSADFGVPTLKRLFKNREAEAYLRKNTFLHDQIQKIFWAPRGHSLQTSEESLTVEDMLTLLKDWKIAGEPQPKPAIDDIEKIRKGLYILIKKAVFDNKNTDAGRFLNNIIGICNKKFSHTTWASFNWDCIFESSFWYSSAPRGGVRKNPRLAIDLDGWTNGSPKHLFLKLHGGVNWWDVRGVKTYLSFGRSGPLSLKWQEFEDSGSSDSLPIILEPSAYKYKDPLYRSTLKPQWDAFYKQMLEADCIVILGYSFPEADAEARLNLMTAFQMNTKCKWLIVDPSEEVCAKYKRFMGSKNVSILTMGFAAFNSDVRANLNAAFPEIDFSENKNVLEVVDAAG